MEKGIAGMAEGLVCLGSGRKPKAGPGEVQSRTLVRSHKDEGEGGVYQGGVESRLARERRVRHPWASHHLFLAREIELYSGR